MNYNLAIDLIISRQKYPKVYHFTYVLLAIIFILIYVIFTYRYQTYYLLKGRIINNEIELLVPMEEIKGIEKEHNMLIDNMLYSYKITHINQELYIDNNYQNYCYLYLKVDNLTNIDNFVYEIKIPKENKTLANYLKDYL